MFQNYVLLEPCSTSTVVDENEIMLVEPLPSEVYISNLSVNYLNDKEENNCQTTNWKRKQRIVWRSNVSRKQRIETDEEDFDPGPPLLEPSYPSTYSIDDDLEKIHISEKSLELAAKRNLSEDFTRKYLNKIAKKFTRKKATFDDTEILTQLNSFKFCDVDELVCTRPHCQWRFQSIQVLAYHVSYAHRTPSMKLIDNALCYLCGMNFDTSKSKLVHMMKAHKTEAEQHQKNCRKNREIFQV